MNTLEGRSVLVTGGGTGIGAAVAERLVRDGATVTICGRSRDTLEVTADRIAGRLPGSQQVLVTTADVTEENEVRELMSATVQAVGRLDGVVANAGGGGALAPYHLQEVDEFARVLRLNVVGTMLLVKHAVPLLIQSGEGSFVGMSSIAAGLTHANFGAYPVAKAGIDQIMRNAADEFGYANVRFNAIRPGFIATEVMQAIPPSSQTYESYRANTPLPRLGRPEDVAALCSFLIGPESSWITGQVIGIDGGHSLRRGPDFEPFVQHAYGDKAIKPTNTGD